MFLLLNKTSPSIELNTPSLSSLLLHRKSITTVQTHHHQTRNPAINSRASSSQPQSTAARPLPSHNQQPDRSHICTAAQQPPGSSLCLAVPLLCPEIVTCNCPLPLSSPSRAPPFAQKP
ncbi:hypothetical protein ACFE04_030353 [Oxalis oulophora]